jgi:hypothetical protein
MSIEAYASATSVRPGEQLDFMVSYDHGPSSPDFTVQVSRLGATAILSQLSGRADAYPTPVDYNYSGCQWPVACSLVVPDDWTSGVYRARLTGSSGDGTDLLFVVKAATPGAGSPILLALTVTTYQAYNGWGGGSLYSDPRSVTVTFDRPGDQLGHMNEFGETTFISWAEGNNIALEYCTGVDLHANPNLLNYYQLLLSVGHDEYWSKEMRDGVESFIANGGNAAFFSGNTCWWQVRFESNNRRMVCYKSDENPDTPDPLINGKLFCATNDNKLWWRDPVGWEVNWEQIGHANGVVAMAAINGKLFCATNDNKLWWRDPVGWEVNWEQIGHANGVVAMAAINGKLFCATNDNGLWWRDPVGWEVNWEQIGHANLLN